MVEKVNPNLFQTFVGKIRSRLSVKSNWMLIDHSSKSVGEGGASE